MNRHSLPPLPAVRAFEAAARNMSFTKAGAELGMTQAAVSYQIKVLEDRLGFPVFIRKPRKLELTEKGAHLASRVSESFSALNDIFADALGQNDTQLVISCNTTFAVHWLSTRLFEFQMLNSGIAVRLVPDNAMKVSEHAETDVSIGCSCQDARGMMLHPLLPAVFTPILSRQLLETVGELNEPADIFTLPLVDAVDPWWSIWLEAAGAGRAVSKLQDVASRQNLCLGSQALAANRALSGMGVAILTPHFYRRELENGTLIQPFETLAQDDNKGWCLYYPQAKKNSRKVRLFRNWLFAQLQKEGVELDEQALQGVLG